MKCKIFITNRSGIDNISHSKDIVTIPYSYEFQENVIFTNKDLTPEAIYLRERLDESFNAKLVPISKDEIKEMIDSLIKNQYDSFVFILNEEDKLYQEYIEEIKKEYAIKFLVYVSRLVSFSLSSIALELVKKIDSFNDLEDVNKFLTEKENKTSTWYFSLEKDYSNTVNITSIFNSKKKPIVKYYKNDISGIEQLEFKTIDMFFKEYFSSIKNIKQIPFIIYTSKYSVFYDYLFDLLNKVYPELKKVNAYVLPVEEGITLGFNSFGLGYIEAD